jgi:hypothetical protein
MPIPVVTLPSPALPPKPGVRVAEADLRPNEIQDLADVIGELTSAAVGSNLKFHLRIELDGDGQPQDDVVDRTHLKNALSKIRIQAS